MKTILRHLLDLITDPQSSRSAKNFRISKNTSNVFKRI